METDDFILRHFPASIRPYLVVTAGIMIQFTLGLVYSFGNMLPYLASYIRWKINPEQTQGSMIWLQSLMAGLPFAMLAGGYIERKIGARKGAAVGCLLYTGLLAVSYFSIQHSYLLLLLTLGLLSSFGTGITYNCILIQCQRWFPQHIGLVSGLITAGFGSGAFLISPLQTEFINPENLEVNEEGFFTQVELLERVPQMFLLLAIFFGTLQIIGLFFIAAPKSGRSTASSFTTDPLLQPTSDNGSTVVREHPTFDKKEILLSDTFFFLFLTLMLNGIWVQTTSGYYKAYGQKFIHDDFFLATVNSFAAVCNCFSRIAWGYIGDKISYQTSMCIACGCGAALMWTLGLVRLTEDRALFFVWIALMYCCVGATYSLVPFATHRSFGPTNFGIVYGYVQVSLGVAGLITALCSQFLLNVIGFQWMFTLIGGTTTCVFFLTLFISRTKFGTPLAPVFTRNSLQLTEHQSSN